jgi:hypothetical protein
MISGRLALYLEMWKTIYHAITTRLDHYRDIPDHRQNSGFSEMEDIDRVIYTTPLVNKKKERNVDT